jgi:hypothetical protein
MREIETYGTIKEGKLSISYREQFINNLKLLNDCRVLVTIRKIYRKRSNQLNRYYWGCVIPIVQAGLKDTGNIMQDKEDVHELLKFKCIPLKEIVNNKTGQIEKTLGTTTTMTNVEFMEYLEDIKHWAFDFLNITIPDPNEQTEIEL